jgi:hypothetical protein
MMNILASCKQRLAERRAERLAKARSDEIDRQLQEECLANREQPKQHDILLLGSCFPSFLIQVIVRADWVNFDSGIPGSQANAFAIVDFMKNVHDPHACDNSTVKFRPVIWKNLLENSRNIVWALRKLNLDHANHRTKVR